MSEKNCQYCHGSGQIQNPIYNDFFNDIKDRNGQLIELENGSHEQFFKKQGYMIIPPVVIACECAAE